MAVSSLDKLFDFSLLDIENKTVIDSLLDI